MSCSPIARTNWRLIISALPLACFSAAILAGHAAPAAENLLTVVTPPASVPAGLSAQIQGGETLSWDSNPLLLTTGEKSLFGSTTAPELILRDSTPTSLFSADTIVDENIYNQSAFNSTDGHETASFSDQIQQWGLGIKGQADYDTIRSSELTTFGLDLPSVRHTGLSVAPEVAYNVSALDKLSVSGSVLRSTYDNPAFVDYDLFTAAPSWAHSFDPLNTGTFTINAQRYQTEQGSTLTVDSIGPSVGWKTILTPRLSASLSGGIQKSEQSGSGQSGAGSNADSSSWNYVFSGDLTYRGEQDKTDLIASRSQYPFSNGTDTLLTSFSLNEVHDLNQMVSLNLGGSYQFAQTPPSSTGINFKSEASGSAGVSYHIFQYLDLTASYQYKDESLTETGNSITDQTVLLTLTYHPSIKQL